MMDKHVSDLKLAYIENRLPSESRARVEAHLSACVECRREVNDTQHAMAMLTDAKRALSRLQAAPARRRSWNDIRRRLAAPTPLDAQRLMPRWAAWQVAVSMTVVAMALASSFTLNAVRAATPSIPAIQTPVAHVIEFDDTATVRATFSQDSARTPTITPKPIGTN